MQQEKAPQRLNTRAKKDNIKRKKGPLGTGTLGDKRERLVQKKKHFLNQKKRTPKKKTISCIAN
jgi:hypothetical protein